MVEIIGRKGRSATLGAVDAEREQLRTELVELMRELFEESDGNYGVPRMYKELRRAGLSVNGKKVRRLMRLHGMAGRCRRRTCRLECQRNGTRHLTNPARRFPSHEGCKYPPRGCEIEGYLPTFCALLRGWA